MLPVLGIFASSITMHSLVADQYQYLPVIGLIAVVCAGCSTWLHSGRGRSSATPWPSQPSCCLAGGRPNGRPSSHPRTASGQTPYKRTPGHGWPRSNLGARLVLKAHGMGPAAQQTQTEIQELRARSQAMLAQGDAIAAKSDEAAAAALGRELETEIGAFQGLCRESIPHLRRSLELQPLFHRTYTSLGLSLVCIGDDAQAIEVYRRGIEVEDRYFPTKRDADLSRNLARMLVQYGRFAEAVPVARRAVELLPGDPAAQADLGERAERPRILARAAQVSQPGGAPPSAEARPGTPCPRRRPRRRGPSGT